MPALNNTMDVNTDYTYSKNLAGSNVQPTAHVDLNTGRQIGTTSDPSIFPASYDYTVVSASDGDNPSVIDYYIGGSYDTGTGVYTGGTKLFTHYIKYTAGLFVSKYVLIY